jgi:serpin B
VREPDRSASRLSSVLSRRELMRVASLGGLVVALPTLATACSSHDTKPRATSPVNDGAITLVSSHVARTPADPAAAAGAAGAMQVLGGALYGQLASAGGNLALSPYSVAVALGMTVNGAAGRTRDEMLAVLHEQDVATLDADDNALTQYVESLAGPVPHVKGAEIALDAANQLFGQQGVTWTQPFLDALAASFGAGLREVDYEHAVEAARTLINQWTSDQTHGRIPQIVPAGALDDSTRLVLVNTLYFKAPWSTQFDKTATADGDFHLADGSTASVPMMHGSVTASLGSGEGWKSARVTYAGEQLAMTLVLPDEGRLADVEQVLTTSPGNLLATQSSGELDLTMPSWKFTTAAGLKAPLSALGMPTAFSGDDADFSGMTDPSQLFISDVLHQVFIAVDEDGTEAAAATAVVMDFQMGVAGPPLTLVLDRPFLFVIHDVAYGTPLFLGRVADPRS